MSSLSEIFEKQNSKAPAITSAPEAVESAPKATTPSLLPEGKAAEREPTAKPVPTHKQGICAATRKYDAAGLCVIRLNAGSKSAPKGWNKQHIASAEAEQYFDADSNIGVRMGEPSNGYVDLDFDCAEACAAAAIVFDDSPSFGRASAPGGHRLVRCPGVKSRTFDLPATLKDDPRIKGADHGLKLLELRSTGQQTMFPPSIHPSGERIVWENDIAPPEMAADELHRSLGLVALVAAVAKLFPGPGVRCAFMMALAGALAHAGIEPEMAQKLVQLVGHLNGDEGDGGRWRVANERAADRVANGEEVTGLPTLCEIAALDDKCLKRFRDWLAEKTDVAPPRVAGVPMWRDFADKHCTIPKSTLRNTVIGIEALGIGCRLDIFHEMVLVDYNGVSAEVQTLVGELTDHRLGAIRSLIDKRYGFDPGDHNVLAAVREIARDHAFHPPGDYLDKVQAKWDMIERLDRAAVTYFRAEDTPLNRAQIRKALIASVRRIRQPGVKFDNIITLESEEGKGKSTSVEILYGEENFSDQTLLGLQDREIQERLAGVWGFEIADLAGMSKAEIDRVKAQTSRREDRARPAYGHMVEKRKRTCVLWASTNNQNYLKSQTGNRRFWPIAVGDIDLEALRRDRDQLWGEAATLEAAGESLLLDKSLWADAAEAQEERREVDPWEDLLANIPQSVNYGIDGKSIQILFTQEVVGAGREIRVSSAALLTYILKIPSGLQHGAQATRLGTVMKRLGWQRPKGRSLRVNGTTVSGFFREDVLDPQVANSGNAESYGQAALALGRPEGGAP